MSAEPGHWVALGAAIMLIFAAIGAGTARSLFAAVLFLFAAALAGAVALVALDAPRAGLAAALIGAGVVVVILLGAVLITSRAAKELPLGVWIAALVFAPLAGCALVWAAPWPAEAMPAPPSPLGAAELLMGVLALAGAAAIFGLLGRDDRAAFAPPERER